MNHYYQKHYQQHGFIAGNLRDIGISNEDISQMANVVGTIPSSHQYNSQFPKSFDFSRKRTFMNIKTNDPKHYNTPLVHKVLDFMKQLGHTQNTIAIRTATYKNHHNSYDQTQTSIHRDFFPSSNNKNNEDMVLFVMVIEQTNIESCMSIVESTETIVHPYMDVDDALTNPLEFVKTLWSERGKIGTYYMINQRDFPKLFHHVIVDDPLTRGEKEFTRTVVSIIMDTHKSTNSSILAPILLGSLLGLTLSRIMCK